MIKSGLILGVVTLVLGIGAALVSPFCVPCVAILAGLGAGYLAGVFDKPLDSGASAKAGAGAGAIGGAGALLGHLIGGGLNALFLSPTSAAALVGQLGLPSSGDPTSYYAGVFGIACCLGLVEVVIMAALGAGGGALWYQLTGKKTAAPVR